MLNQAPRHKHEEESGSKLETQSLASLLGYIFYTSFNEILSICSNFIR